MQPEYYSFPDGNSIYNFGDNYETDAYHMAMRQMDYEKNMLAKQTARADAARAEATAAAEAAKVERLVAKRLGSRGARGGTSHFTELEIMQLEKYFMVVIFLLVILVVVNIGTLVVTLNRSTHGSGTTVFT